MHFTGYMFVRPEANVKWMSVKTRLAIRLMKALRLRYLRLLLS